MPICWALLALPDNIDVTSQPGIKCSKAPILPERFRSPDSAPKMRSSRPAGGGRPGFGPSPGGNDRLVSRLANDGRVVGSHGDSQRYLLRPDDAGFRLRQLAERVPLKGGKRPETTAGRFLRAQWACA